MSEIGAWIGINQGFSQMGIQLSIVTPQGENPVLSVGYKSEGI